MTQIKICVKVFLVHDEWMLLSLWSKGIFHYDDIFFALALIAFTALRKKIYQVFIEP